MNANMPISRSAGSGSRAGRKRRNLGPDGFGLVVVGLTFASVVYLFVRMCRRWPIPAGSGLVSSPVCLAGRPGLCPHRGYRRRRGQRDQRQRQLRRGYRRHLFRRWRRLVGLTGGLRWATNWFSKKLFALTQGRPAPPKEQRTIRRTSLAQTRKLGYRGMQHVQWHPTPPELI